MEEADGLVYCTFQNISTARLAGAVASLGQTGPQDSGRDPWGLSTGQQAPLSKGRSRGEVRMAFGDEKEKGGTWWDKCLCSYSGPVWADAKGISLGSEVSETWI